MKVGKGYAGFESLFIIGVLAASYASLTITQLYSTAPAVLLTNMMLLYFLSITGSHSLNKASDGGIPSSRPSSSDGNRLHPIQRQGYERSAQSSAEWRQERSHQQHYRSIPYCRRLSHTRPFRPSPGNNLRHYRQDQFRFRQFSEIKS